MHIQSLFTVGTNANAATSSATNATSPLQDTNNMFMKLLTAQLQNQSPLNPVDPTQFTSQLVQFNMLDQLTQIRNLLQTASSGQPSGNAVRPTSGGN